METILTGDKRLAEVVGISLADGAAFRGYGIHSGRTSVASSATPLLRLTDGSDDGVVSADGRIAGCYVHGLFDHPAQHAACLSRLGVCSDGVDEAHRIDVALDPLADSLAGDVDTDTLLSIAGGAA